MENVGHALSVVPGPRGSAFTSVRDAVDMSLDPRDRSAPAFCFPTLLPTLTAHSGLNDNDNGQGQSVVQKRLTLTWKRQMCPFVQVMLLEAWKGNREKCLDSDATIKVRGMDGTRARMSQHGRNRPSAPKRALLRTERLLLPGIHITCQESQVKRITTLAQYVSQ